MAHTVRDDYTHPELEWVGNNRLIFIISNYNTNIDEKKEITIFSKKSSLDTTLLYTFLRPKQEGRTLCAFFKQNGSTAKSDTFYVIAKAIGWYETRNIQGSGIVEGTEYLDDALKFTTEADPNTKYEGWLHYEDNVRRQILTSLEEWIKSGKKGPFNG